MNHASFFSHQMPEARMAAELARVQQEVRRPRKPHSQHHRAFHTSSPRGERSALGANARGGCAVLGSDVTRSFVKKHLYSCIYIWLRARMVEQFGRKRAAAWCCKQLA
jgi:hypothetical protein